MRISIASTPAHLPVVRAAVAEIGRLVGFDDLAIDAVMMAIDEALANIIKHAYDGQEDQPIDVSFTALCEQGTQTGIAVVLEDLGKPIDPQTLHGRDLDDVRPGGLGTHVMAACVDRISYAARAGGGTRLTMIKYLKENSEPSNPQLTGGRCG